MKKSSLHVSNTGFKTHVTPVLGSMSYIITDNEPGYCLFTVLDEWTILRIEYPGFSKWRAMHVSTMKAALEDDNHPHNEKAEEMMMFLDIVANHYGRTIEKN